MRLIKIGQEKDIPDTLTDTPIHELLACQNWDAPHKVYTKAQLLIGMCMDHRKHLHIPENFAYIIRTGGGNLRYSAFKVSYAIAVGGVRHIALIAHNHCGMVDLNARREQFVEGLCTNAGWSREQAEEHFSVHAPLFEIENEATFVLEEALRLSGQYPGVCVTPLYYTLEDNRLSLIMP